MKKLGKILLIGLVLFGISSLATFSWKAKLPQDFDYDYIDRASYLCTHPFGFPMNISTWENHCLSEESIILGHVINLVVWILIALLGYLVVTNYQKLKAKLGPRGSILLPLILLISAPVVAGCLYVISFLVWVFILETWGYIISLF